MKKVRITPILALAIALAWASVCAAGPNTASLSRDGGFVIGPTNYIRGTNMKWGGVHCSAGHLPREVDVRGKIGKSMQKFLDGKISITFIPIELAKFVNLNPDEIIKTLPFSHYLSYIFDYTSKLPIEQGLAKDPVVAPFKVHVGTPETNQFVSHLKDLMLVKFQKNDRGGHNLIDPDGTIYTDPRIGVAQIVFHTSPKYWKPFVERIKQWYKNHFGLKGRDESIELIRDGMKELGLSDVSDDGVDKFIDSFDDRGIHFLFWRVLESYRSRKNAATSALGELVQIFKDLALTETVVAGVGDDGLFAAGQLFQIGGTLPFPNMEFLLKLIKDIWAKIKGIPNISFGFPKEDLRIAVVVRRVNNHFVEIRKVFCTSKEFADVWQPSFLRRDAYRKVLRCVGDRTEKAEGNFKKLEASMD